MNHKYNLNNDEIKFLVKLTEDFIGSTTVDGKTDLINNRFNKILRDNNYEVSGKEILEGLKKGKFKQDFINVFTTNTTRFFREVSQFNWLFNDYVPNKNLKIWSSAASSGEEAHTILCTLEGKKDIKKESFTYEIIGTDISTKVLDVANKNEYINTKVFSSTPNWLTTYDKYWNDLDGSYFKLNKTLSNNLKFKQANLLEPSSFNSINNIDIIFCRNMLIYFNKDLQEKILKNIFSKLNIGGYILLGHSETPWGLETKIEKTKYHNVFKKIKN